MGRGRCQPDTTSCPARPCQCVSESLVICTAGPTSVPGVTYGISTVLGLKFGPAGGLYEDVRAQPWYRTVVASEITPQGRSRCVQCELQNVSGAHRRTGYVFTNYHLFVLHANTLRYIVLQICITQNTGEYGLAKKIFLQNQPKITVFVN